HAYIPAVAATVEAAGIVIGDIGSHAVAARRLRAVLHALGAQLVGDRGGDQVLLGREVGVEGAVGQPGVRHQGRDSRAVDAVCLQPAAGHLDDAAPGRLLVLLAVSGHAALLPARPGSLPYAPP